MLEGPKDLTARRHPELLVHRTSLVARVLGDHFADHRSNDDVWQTTIALATDILDDNHHDVADLGKQDIWARVSADRTYDSEQDMAYRAFAGAMTDLWGEAVHASRVLDGQRIPDHIPVPIHVKRRVIGTCRACGDLLLAGGGGGSNCIDETFCGHWRCMTWGNPGRFGTIVAGVGT